MNIILLGPPGSGKGTQAVKVAEYKNLSHISMGDILRKEMKEKTDIGIEAESYIKNGLLVPDDVVNKIALKAIQNSNKNGFLLDGYPRTLYQAEFLSKYANIDRVIYLDVPLEIIIERLAGRLVCKSCAAVYHKTNNPPKKEGICDQCGGELYVRDDDKEETIVNRFKIYTKETQPLLDYYKDKLVKINGANALEDVFESIKKVL